jgi:hypothetical protein
MAAALRSEVRGRVEAGTFFGHIAYVSLVARKPAYAPEYVEGYPSNLAF